MLRWQDSVLDRREVSPQELDYRVATGGFENCRALRAAGLCGVAGWSVIDFAYDTDWTGLRYWTGFLPGLAFLHLRCSRIFPPAYSPLFLPRPRRLFLLPCEYDTLGLRVPSCKSRACMHVASHILVVSPRVFLREAKGSLSYLTRGDVEGDWPRTSDLCDLRGCIYERSDSPRTELSYCT